MTSRRLRVTNNCPNWLTWSNRSRYRSFQTCCAGPARPGRIPGPPPPCPELGLGVAGDTGIPHGAGGQQKRRKAQQPKHVHTAEHPPFVRPIGSRKSVRKNRFESLFMAARAGCTQASGRGQPGEADHGADLIRRLPYRLAAEPAAFGRGLAHFLRAFYHRPHATVPNLFDHPCPAVWRQRLFVAPYDPPVQGDHTSENTRPTWRSAGPRRPRQCAAETPIPPGPG